MVEVVETSRQDSVGITVSFALTLNQIAIILAPPVFGFIMDIKGYTWAWVWVCMAILLFVSAISLLKNCKKSHTNDIFLQYDV
ncbi:putative membrane protein [Bacillus pseudomycoides]|nr:putative membrane protein [Bacillus pseudomycoides]AJI18984.1 putative membrane protein [Bacillus pseudomycoides]